jgi:hypothetical protein
MSMKTMLGQNRYHRSQVVPNEGQLAANGFSIFRGSSSVDRWSRCCPMGRYSTTTQVFNLVVLSRIFDELRLAPSGIL